MAEVFLTQPLEIVIGGNAGSKWMSDDLFERAASSKKHLHVIKGANHMQLYDIEKYVSEGISVLVKFFAKNLK